MSSMTAPQIDILLPLNEPSFQIDGKVVEVLPGSGMAALHTNTSGDYTFNRGTDGVHFDDLCIGDTVHCEIAIDGNRVLYAHQQTRPVPGPIAEA